MHADMTAVIMQSNKIVSNEVKNSYTLLEPLYRKNIMDFSANPVNEPAFSPALE